MRVVDGAVSNGLSPDGLAFARSTARAFLLTRRGSGGPTGHPMTLRVSTEGDLLFNAYRASVKVRNLVRDPRVAVLVTTPAGDPDPRALLVTGTAEVLSVDDGIRAWETSGGGAGVGGTAAEVVTTVRDRMADGRRVIVRVRPERAGEPTGPA